MRKLKFVSLVVLIALMPASYVAGEIFEIPISVQADITQDAAAVYQAAMPATWDPVQDPMPGWLAGIIDVPPLEWLKEYNPLNPADDPDHPISVTVTNNSAVEWTDFHFDILPHPLYGGDMSSMSIELTAPAPGSDHALDGIDVNNAVTALQGPQIHYWHWTSLKPIQPGDTVNYSFLLHNPANQAFKLNFYPTLAIPEPATLLLLACGAIAPLWRRRMR